MICTTRYCDVSYFLTSDTQCRNAVIGPRNQLTSRSPGIWIIRTYERPIGDDVGFGVEARIPKNVGMAPQICIRAKYLINDAILGTHTRRHRPARAHHLRSGQSLSHLPYKGALLDADLRSGQFSCGRTSISLLGSKTSGDAVTKTPLCSGDFLSASH